MDINELLRVLRLTIKQMAVEVPGCAEWVAHAAEVNEYVTEIDKRISAGGQLPTAWAFPDQITRRV